MQRIWGGILIALSIMLIAFTSGGSTPDERDGTAALVLIPIGIFLMTTKRCVIRGDGDDDDQGAQPESGEMCPGCRYNTHTFIPHPRCRGCDGWNRYRKGARHGT